MTASPPKPRLALSVGVVGHRPNRLPEAACARVAVRICEAFTLLASAVETAQRHRAVSFAEGPPTLRIVSALAEGADRLAARAAMEYGFALSAVLPFAAAEYEKDFVDRSSLAEFRALLDKAEGALDLCGSRAREPYAYEAAGLTILGNADILLAIWDGGPSAGRGGTTEMIERAAREGVPIIHVDTRGEMPTRLLWSGLTEFSFAGNIDLAEIASAPIDEVLGDVVDRIVRPPADAAEAAKLSCFLDETWTPRNLRPEVPLLLLLLGVRAFRGTDLRPLGPDRLAADFIASAGGEGAATLDRERQGALAPVASAFGWADALGVRYAQMFRGAYVFSFIAAALAAVTGVISLVAAELFGSSKMPFGIVQFLLIGGAILNTVYARRRDWHGRWIEAREVAERIRAGLPIWVLGERPKAFSAAEPTWTGWYARAHFRALGLPAGALDADKLVAIGSMINGIVDDQHRYHDSAAKQMEAIARRIGLVVVAVFLSTLIVSLTELLPSVGWHMPSRVSPILTGLASALSALGAAIYAIRIIGDFEASAHRSRRTAGALRVVAGGLRKARCSLEGLRSLARAASDTMLGDVAHWRLASETRRLDFR